MYKKAGDHLDLLLFYRGIYKFRCEVKLLPYKVNHSKSKLAKTETPAASFGRNQRP